VGIIGNYRILVPKYFIEFAEGTGIFLFNFELWYNHKIPDMQVIDIQTIGSGLIGIHGAGEFNRMKAVIF
jgi:hypothetical protein